MLPILLAAGACGLDSTTELNPVTVAAIIEFIHTATLLHDDVVDASDLRRGQDTANAVWGNEAAVLVGDFLYSRSFIMIEEEVRNIDVMSILASTTNRIAEGEVMRLLEAQAKRVATAISDGGLEHLDDVLDIIEKTDALANSIRRAVESSDNAIATLAALPDSDCRNALEQIARYSVERTF